MSDAGFEHGRIGSDLTIGLPTRPGPSVWALGCMALMTGALLGLLLLPEFLKWGGTAPTSDRLRAAEIIALAAFCFPLGYYMGAMRRPEQPDIEAIRMAQHAQAEALQMMVQAARDRADYLSAKLALERRQLLADAESE